jgi:hypothetical protein
MARITGQGPQSGFANPAWAKDYFNREHLIAGGARVDPLQFPRDDSVIVTLGAGGYVAAATTAPVTALPGPVPANSQLIFNNGITLWTTAAAIAGATSLTVQAASFAIPAGAVAVYQGTGRVYVANGTVVGRLYTERDAGVGFGPAAAGDVAADAGEVYILAHDIDDALTNADCTLYRPGSMIDEAHLAGWTALAAGIKTYLRTRYLCTRGAD